MANLGDDEPLLILGASARAAAQSALRAGFRVTGIDLYGDLDLQAACDCVQATDIPDLFARARTAPPGPWLYTGGLENYPRLVQKLARERHLLGVSQLAPLRDLEAVNELLVAAELPTIVHQSASALPTAGNWLLKPLRSSGGHRIRVCKGPPYVASFELASTHYWSPWIEGLPVGATYVIGQGNYQLLGVCEQLCGAPWTGARGVTYAGSIGPLQLADDVQSQFARLGEQLAARHFVRGLIGVDAILTADGQVRVLEINPRYTASVEILERALGIQAIELHVSACRATRHHWACPSGAMTDELQDLERDPQMNSPALGPASAGTASPVAGRSLSPWGKPRGDTETDPSACESSGKAVLYATRPLCIANDFVDHCLAENANLSFPRFADISAAGTQIETGQPIVTIFASGGCVESVRFALRKQAGATFARLGMPNA